MNFSEWFEMVRVAVDQSRSLYFLSHRRSNFVGVHFVIRMAEGGRENSWLTIVSIGSVREACGLRNLC